MEIKDLELWNNITFKTQGYRKNFDLVTDNENIITEYDGAISEIRIAGKKLPITVGEYSFSVWNIGLGKKLRFDLNKLMTDNSEDDLYNELITVLNNKEFNLSNYKKIILIHSLVIHKNYRKRGISEEFMEMIYRDFHADDVAIIMLVKPFQNNITDANYYLKIKTVPIKESLDNTIVMNVSASEYYSLKDFIEKKDVEYNEYKLFSIASRCGFKRLGESHLFIFSPEEILKRMDYKYKNKLIL